MQLSRTNIVLTVLLVIVVLAAAFGGVNYSRPNFEIYLGDDMTYSPAYGAYQPNTLLADGRTQQAPVPGTIARGELPLHFEATPEDAVRAGEQLENPYEAESDELRAAVERGSEVFRVYCIVCHGASGTGDGPVVARGFPPPPSLLTGKTLQMKDGQLIHILTYGQNSMPIFAAQLPLGRRWDVVNYIRSLQQQATSSPAATEPAGGITDVPPETEDQGDKPDAPDGEKPIEKPPKEAAEATESQQQSKTDADTPDATDIRLAGKIVVFRSAKERPFAERKATLERTNCPRAI